MPTATPSQIVRGAPYFLVPDVAAAGDYYREVLGFQREYAAGSPPEFAIYVLGFGEEWPGRTESDAVAPA